MSYPTITRKEQPNATMSVYADLNEKGKLYTELASPKLVPVGISSIYEWIHTFGMGFTGLLDAGLLAVNDDGLYVTLDPSAPTSEGLTIVEQPEFVRGMFDIDILFESLQHVNIQPDDLMALLSKIKGHDTLDIWGSYEALEILEDLGSEGNGTDYPEDVGKKLTGLCNIRLPRPAGFPADKYDYFYVLYLDGELIPTYDTERVAQAVRRHITGAE